MALRNAYTQWFPPKPTFTDQNVSSQSGKVFIVTGGSAGIGFELIKILYAKGATVYMASRSQEKAEAAIQAIQAIKVENPGAVKFLHLDLDDLSTIKDSANAFTAQESQLDPLWNNAGIGAAPTGTKTRQGLEGHIGINCVGHFLFTRLLLPHLRAAAKSAPKDSVRVVWTSSWLAESQAPKGGIDFDELAKGGSKNPQRDYATSKAGNWILAMEGAKRFGDEGILSVVQNPGNILSGIWKYIPKTTMMFMNPLLHEARLGAYTELYAGLSQEITAKENGAYIIPWGRLQKSTPRKDIIAAVEGKGAEPSVAEKFWNWCEERTDQYV